MTHFHNKPSFQNANKQNYIQNTYSFRQLTENAKKSNTNRVHDHHSSNHNIQQPTRLKTYHQNYASFQPSPQASRIIIEKQAISLTKALRMENDSLKTTLQLTKQNNLYLEKSIVKYRKELNTRDKIIKKQQEQLITYRKDIQKKDKQIEDYDALIPKLTQLQQLQNGIMKDNQKLRQSEAIYQSVMKTMKNILTKEKTSSSHQLLLLLEALQMKQVKIQTESLQSHIK